jgi:hypothetical protein
VVLREGGLNVFGSVREFVVNVGEDTCSCSVFKITPGIKSLCRPRGTIKPSTLGAMDGQWCHAMSGRPDLNVDLGASAAV